MAIPEAAVTQQLGQAAQQGVQRVGQYAQQTLQSAGNGLWGTIKGFITSPLTLAGNVGKEAISQLVHNGWKLALGAAAVSFLMPEWIGRAAEFANKPEWVTKAIEFARQGPAQLAVAAGLTGAALPAIVGGVQGAFRTLTAGFGGSGSSESPAQENGVGLGTTIGTGLALAAVAYVGMGAIKKDGIAHDKQGGDGVEPPRVPDQSPISGGPSRTA